MNADTDCAPNPEKSADVDNCNSSHLAHKEDVRLRHFHPSREMFHLILERSHSYRDLLEGSESFARHLGVPLISDDVARGICEIFQVPRPYVLGPENGGCGGSVSWLDVVQETDYQAEPQQGGTYHCRLHDQGVWVQLSNCQHELLLTGLPQRLIHPWSYEKDVRTELETLALAITEISKWETLASEVLEVTKDVRMRAAKRIRVLSGNLQSDRVSENANANPDLQRVVSAEEEACTHNCTEKQPAETLPLIANNRRWDPEQKRRVFQWFESQSRLPKDDVVKQFERDFGYCWSYSAIQSIWYQMRRQR